jgi:hypothetical protein
MTLDAEEIARAAVASLTDEDRRGAVVYIDDRVLAPGEELEVDGARVAVDAPTVVAFADLEPGVNWGHRCRYLLVDRDSGDVRSIDAQFPPFLRGAPPGLRVVHRGPGVPQWAVATE